MEGTPRRIGLGWVLAGIVCGYIIFNVLVQMLFNEGDPPEPIHALILGIWIFEPMLLAIWAALGTGRFLVRTLLIAPCVMLLVATPGLHRKNFMEIERYEFVVVAIAAMSIFAAVTAILLLCRRFFGWRIDDVRRTATPWRPFQYDTRYLIALITLYALALGVTSSLQFGPPAWLSPFLGPDFVIFVLALGSALGSLLLLPLLAVPLLVLSEQPSERFIWRAVALWMVVTAGIGIYWIIVEGIDVTLYPLLIQLGAAISGTLTALPLRLAGYRFTSREPPLAIELATFEHG